MTNHWIDIKNADVILVMGSNPASNHPISMKWVMKAKENGAKLIVVDPRFTQTAAKADVYAAMRSGTDIAFLGGMIKYIIDNNLIFSEYVVKYTNAPFLVNPDFKGPAELNGLYSGYDEKTRKYDKKTWSFQMDENGVPKKDPTLKDPELRIPANEETLLPLHPRQGFEHHGYSQGEAGRGLQTLCLDRQAEPGRAPSSMPWAGPSTPSAPRTSGP